jgi:hypothetical protein
MRSANEASKNTSDRGKFFVQQGAGQTMKISIKALAIVMVAGFVQSASAEAPERLFLQQVSSSSAVVKWRGGDGDTVCYSRKIKNLRKSNWPDCVTGIATEGGHLEAHLTGLDPDKDYFYSVGGHVDEGQHFNTAPNSNKPPSDGNTHILIVGDSGTITDGVSDELPEGEHPGEAQAVLDGYYAYNAANGGEDVDMLLALGDNAYEAGTDEEWQKSFFELYPDILRSANAITTIGNHEMGFGRLDLPGFILCAILDIPAEFCMPPFVPWEPNDIVPLPLAGGSASSDPASYDGDGNLQPDGTGIPYLDIFSQPSQGESGGVPSGTEQYFSVDYGSVHVELADLGPVLQHPGLDDRHLPPPDLQQGHQPRFRRCERLTRRSTHVGHAERVHADLRGIRRGCGLQRTLPFL